MPAGGKGGGEFGAVSERAEQRVDRLGDRIVLRLLGEDQAVADLQHGEGEGEDGAGREVRADERDGDSPQRAQWRRTE